MSKLPSETLRLADLPNRRETPFSLRPTSDELQSLATELGLSGLKKLTFIGEIAPANARDWLLKGNLGATVVQPCVATLAPVTTRLEEQVERRYLAETPEIEGLDVEMPEDDTIEEMPAVVDLYTIVLEALALAIPAFPRIEGAEIADIAVTEPGQKPMTDEDAKPFAGLSALKEALEKKGDGDP